MIFVYINTFYLYHQILYNHIGDTQYNLSWLLYQELRTFYKGCHDDFTCLLSHYKKKTIYDNLHLILYVYIKYNSFLNVNLNAPETKGREAHPSDVSPGRVCRQTDMSLTRWVRSPLSHVIKKKIINRTRTDNTCEQSVRSYRLKRFTARRHSAISVDQRVKSYRSHWRACDRPDAPHITSYSIFLRFIVSREGTSSLFLIVATL